MIPEPLLGLRLILGDRAMLEAQGRQYWIVGLGAGASTNAEKFGHEMINRATVGLTVRVYGPHALSLHYVASTREGRVAGSGERHQSVETVTLSYNFLGHNALRCRRMADRRDRGALERPPSSRPRLTLHYGCAAAGGCH